ncbi:hypothetical protein SDC9_206222 [bioreactor metagenome]|uniref:Uncharacterized protein n=1 Tax=bioreactor metagenome TaxID=1076179 RepID=A0A645J549_9ZZZZ
MQPGEKRGNLVEHAGDERHETAGDDQDAETDRPSVQFAGRRPQRGNQQHQQGEHPCHQAKLPVAVGDIGPRPASFSL